MKVALLGLAAAITVVAQDGSKGQVQYGKPSYGDDGYGKPAKKPSYKETRTPKPKPTTDPKKPFDQFYDNLKLCKAEGDLALCIATAQSRHDCLSDKRVNLCTSQFVTGLCSELATTTTGTYNNGYFSATTDSCVDAALADSLLVYNKLLREVNTALAITTQFDQWTFTTVKLALASTRNHADCVIKSFFNFLTQSANNKALRKQDRECLDEALNNSNCKWAQDQTDGWNLPAFLKRYGDLAFNQVLHTLESRFGTSQKSQLNHAISDLLEAVKDQNTQFVEFINSNYDFTHRTTTVNLCTDTNPEHSVGFKDAYGKVIGADATKIKFHLPILEDDFGYAAWYKESPTAWKKAKGDKVPPIVSQCEAFYKSTKDSYDSDVEKGTPWSAFKVKADSSFVGRRGKNWDVECIKADDAATDVCKSFTDNEVAKAVTEANKEKPTKVKTFGADDKVDTAHGAFVRKTRDSITAVNDRCVGLSGHFIKFLETGETKPVKFGDGSVTFGDYTVAVKSPQCKAASWEEPHSCSSHLTQWEQHVTCCKSYHTVLKEFQAAWDSKFGRPARPDRYLEQDFADQKGYSEPKSKPDRPTCVPDKYNTEETIYEKVLLSKADTHYNMNGGLYSLPHLFFGQEQALTTDDIKNVDAALEVADLPYWTRWGSHCAHVYKATKGKYIPFASTWCEKTKEWLNAHAGHPRVQAFAFDKDNSDWLAYKTNDSDRIDGDAPALADIDDESTSTYSHYLSSSSSYKRLCQTLKRSWDLDTVVPIVSTKCFPQSCVLAQLAKCIDVPEKVEAGYDYVTEPQPGYNGYRNNYYQRSMLALESVNTGVLAMAGFVAGAAVVVVAQVMLKARTTGAASSYLLV